MLDVLCSPTSMASSESNGTSLSSGQARRVGADKGTDTDSTFELDRQQPLAPHEQHKLNCDLDSSRAIPTTSRPHPPEWSLAGTGQLDGLSRVGVQKVQVAQLSVASGVAHTGPDHRLVKAAVALDSVAAGALIGVNAVHA